MSDSLPVVLPPSSSLELASAVPLPSAITALGEAGRFCWEEFFSANLRNKHTRRAYTHAVTRFLNWIEPQQIALPRVTPGLVGAYLDAHPGSVPTKKVQLAALRAFLDLLVTRHLLVLNPAASVRGERYSVVEGKTPAMPREHAKRVLDAVDLSRPVGLRDRAILCTCLYTAARDGAIAALRLGDLRFDGVQYSLRFLEKGGKAREIPVRSTLQESLRAYLASFDWQAGRKDEPLFRSVAGRSGELTDRPIQAIDIYRMLKRRLKAAGLPTSYSPHSFRVSVITDLLEQGVPLEDVQRLAGHADPRTTRLYDRRRKTVTRNIVERISF
ncbi:MAG TPA: tyrosine-type recombinase/integrase [Pirellulales bacterium]